MNKSNAIKTFVLSLTKKAAIAFDPGKSEKYLGIFSTEQEAFAAYQRAVEKTGAVMLRNEN